MSYDFYCYRPTSNSPSKEEARAAIESEECTAYRDDDEAQVFKRTLAEALTKYNPRLEIFRPDHEKIAESMKISIEQARPHWNHVELNPPEGDLAIQLQVNWERVFITIPYWYTGVAADRVFELLASYLNVIRKTTGFFAYDPQTDRAFDPERESFVDHAEYDRIAENLPSIMAHAKAENKRPWWKFW